MRILRRRGDLIISETKHGFVCANAGIDLSNVDAGYAALLPDDPDRSARRIRDGLAGPAGVEVGVIVSRHVRPDVAARASPTWPSAAPASRAILDLRGTDDALGRELQVTEVAVVDELAGAAELVMGKADGHPGRGRARRRPGRGSRRGEVARRDRPPPRRRPLPLIAEPADARDRGDVGTVGGPSVSATGERRRSMTIAGYACASVASATSSGITLSIWSRRAAGSVGSTVISQRQPASYS